MSTLDALIAECVANPDDDGPRMVWADAVGGERGELVALQCGRGELPREQIAMCNRRERELLAANELAWSGLDGLARCVRFRRGFVDAIEVEADTWLDHGDRIVATAPLLSSITVVGVHPTYTTIAGRIEARQRLERIVMQPAFARIRGLDLVDRVSHDEGYAWSDNAVQVLLATGVIERLVALGLPRDYTINALVTLTGAPGELAIERLWLRGPGLGGDWFRTLLRKLPRLVELEARDARLSIAAVAQLAHRLDTLGMRCDSSNDLHELADSMLAVRLERLTLESTNRHQLGPEDVARLARLPRLRALDLRGDLAIRADMLHALATTPMPALRELRLGWTPARAELDEVVARLGPQLDLLDLRSANRSAYPVMAADVLVDEPRERSLLHVHATERARWYEPALLDPRGAPIGPEWLVAETGTRAGQIWSFGHIGDDRIRIGRTSVCDVVLSDGSIGRTHAVLMMRNDQRIVHDMGSTNGVVVGGERVSDVALVDGIQLTLGAVILRYFVGAGGGARATACARALATTDPITGFWRQTRPDAARIRIANLAEIAGRSGEVFADAVVAALARRISDAAEPGVALTSPEPGVIGVHPSEVAPDLAAACVLPFDIDDMPVQLQLEVT